MKASLHERGSAATRPLALRMRPDLQVVAQYFRNRRFWGIKDPVSLEYFHLEDEEYAILGMLDGRTSLLQIKERFESQFVPKQLSLDRLQDFLGRLYREGMLLADAGGQSTELLLRHGKQRRRERLRSLSSILAIRFRGVDPEAFLEWLYPFCRWMFSRWFVVIVCVVILAALTLLTVQFDQLQRRLPDLQTFLTPANVVLLVIALAGTKILHEFGHALSCKHFGGECHELGLLFLVFTPCLYCNVSDSWMMQSKWHRVAITAAGMFVELGLAAVCTFLWWFSEPGLLNSLFLNVMVVCSISTLLFNGNPLLRYDGYFILADLLEVPNLGQKSTGLLNRLISGWFTGRDVRRDLADDDTSPWLLGSYAIASAAYRWVVVLSILWFCYRFTASYQVEPAAHVLTAVTLFGILSVPVSSVAGVVRNPVQRHQIRRSRVVATLFLLAVIIGTVGFIPVPFHVEAGVILEPQDAKRVYVSVPGTLEEATEFGRSVEQGQPVARLSNLDVELELAELNGERDRLKLHLQNLELRRSQDPTISARIPTAKEALADAEKRLAQRKRDRQRLTLQSPADGVVIPPRNRKQNSSETGARELRYWLGNPLQKQNVGTPLETGTLFCLIGDPKRLEALLVVSQSDIEFLENGQEVDIQLDQSPGTILSGSIQQISETTLEEAPPELVANGDVPLRIDESGSQRLAEVYYQVRVKLDPTDEPLLIHARGRAKIALDPQPPGRRLFRFLSRTFHFVEPIHR